MNRPTYVAVRATGSCLPQRAMPNREFESLVETSDEWIRTRTGIRERRVAEAHQTSATLGLDAARCALAAAEMPPEEIDLVLCATVTQGMMTPANACLIQAGLGCRPVPAMDLSAACTGFLYALSVGEKFIRTGAARNVLVVGTEVLTRALNFRDRNTCILFGDGAGAVILTAGSDPRHDIHTVQLFSDGSRCDLITVPSIVTSSAVYPEEPGPRDPEFIGMQGREVFKFAVNRMAEMIDDARIDCQRFERSIDLLIPHQVNQRIIDNAIEQTGFPAEKVMVNLDKYGNTSAASIPIALDEAIRSGRAKAGDTLLLVAFGGGLTWGSALMTI